MLVDDDQFLVDMYSIKFKEKGISVETCLDGERAIARLKEGFTPDAIVLDVVMPKMSGIEILERVRKEGLAGNPVVIMLTNQGQDSDVEHAMKLGADGYIIKASAIPSEVLNRVLDIVAEKKKEPTA